MKNLTLLDTSFEEIQKMSVDPGAISTTEATG